MNECGPAGSKEINAVDKLREFGRLETGGTAAEIAAFGNRDARAMLLSFLICDGDPDRTERQCLFDPKFTQMGVAAGKHSSTLRKMAVITFATQFTSKPEVQQTPLADKFKILWQVNEF